MERELKEALATARAECKNQYAISYIDAVGKSKQMRGVEGLRVQLIYVLGNLRRWRGETERRIKLILKKYSKK